MAITLNFARSSATALLLLSSASRSFHVRPHHFIANNIRFLTLSPFHHPVVTPNSIAQVDRPSSRSAQTLSTTRLYLMSRRSSRVAATAATAKTSEAEGDVCQSTKEEGASPKKKLTSKGAVKKSKNDNAETSKKRKTASPSKKSVAAASVTASDVDNDASPKKKSSQVKRASKGATNSSDGSDIQKDKPLKKKAKAADHQRWTERTPLIRHWEPKKASESGSYTFTVISWNVAGLRTFIKKNPDVFANLATTYDADVICLQETKLQEDNLVDPKLKLNEFFEEKLEGYDCHFSCSVEKKGYSGTAMFIKKYGNDAKKGKKQATLGSFFAKNKDDDAESIKDNNQSKVDVPISNLLPVAVTKELGIPAHDGEGRTITAEFPLFYLTNVYVPNSGQKLDRLSYRTTQWDKDFVSKMKQLEQDGGKPIIWLGDLNVAFDEKDTWNEGAKHLTKSAGTTPEERASFSQQLSAGFVDAFRHLHPDGKGHYSYWSQRAGNREPNKGLRLDYFICSQELMTDGSNSKATVRDSYMLPDQLGSDHCPIILDIEIKRG